MAISLRKNGMGVLAEQAEVAAELGDTGTWPRERVDRRRAVAFGAAAVVASVTRRRDLLATGRLLATAQPWPAPLVGYGRGLGLRLVRGALARLPTPR